MINQRRKNVEGQKSKMKIKIKKIKKALILAGEIALEVILIVICRKTGDKKDEKRKK